MERWWLCIVFPALTACMGDPLVPCTGTDGARVICGVQNPEDLARIGDTHFVVVSEFGSMEKELPGGLALLDLDRGKVTPLFPQGGIGVEPVMHEGPDWGDATCAGPPDRQLNPHGLDLRVRADGRLELFVVNHGGREALELFELQPSDSGHYTLDWRGCVPMPAGTFLNDVAALPDGGFVATHMFTKSFGGVALYHMASAMFRNDTGYLLEWHPGAKIHKLRGSDAPFPNGIAASLDGRELFMNVYMSNEVRRIERKTGKLLGTALIAHPDNITWSDDGTLLVASHVGGLFAISACSRITHGACPASFDIVSLDPRTMHSHLLAHREGAPMGAGTVAIAMDHEWLIGSFKSDRLLRIARETRGNDGR